MCSSIKNKSKVFTFESLNHEYFKTQSENTEQSNVVFAALRKANAHKQMCAILDHINFYNQNIEQVKWFLTVMFEYKGDQRILRMSLVIEAGFEQQSIEGTAGFSLASFVIKASAIHYLFQTAYLNLKKVLPALQMPLIGKLRPDHYDVFLPSYSGGVIVHEAMGHFLELRSNAAVVQHLGKQVAQPNVNVIDSPCLSNAFASYQVDDCGRAAKPLPLIRKGKLVNVIASQNPGHCRCENSDYSPVARPTNTLLVSSWRSKPNLVKRHVVIHQFGGGKLSHKTGECTLAIRLATIETQGRIWRLPPFMISISALELLKKVYVTGSKIMMHPSFCLGKSGVLPVSYGHPDLWLKQVELGQ